VHVWRDIESQQTYLRRGHVAAGIRIEVLAADTKSPDTNLT